MASKKIGIKLILLITIAVVLIIALVILIVRSKQSPTASADVVNSDELIIEGSLPALD